MRENTLRTMLTRGRPALNGWLSIPSPVTAELMASFAWDSLTVDLQHGLIDYQAAVGMLQAISTRDILLVQGGVIVVATSYILFNLLADLAQSWLDPRIKS